MVCSPGWCRESRSKIQGEEKTDEETRQTLQSVLQ